MEVVETKGLRVDLSRVVWRKGSRSDNSGPYCVEVARLPDGRVGLRDSKHPDGPVLLFTDGEWEAFLVAAQANEFDDI